MSKPFDLEAAKAGKKFKRVYDKNIGPEKVVDKNIIGISKCGEIVWEYAGLDRGGGIFQHKPEELEMIPEKREKKFILVNQQGTLLAHADTVNNRLWAQKYNHKILKEFTVEWEE